MQSNTISPAQAQAFDHRTLYDLGFSFFSFHSADSPTPETLTTLNRTPGISPFALPLRPNPARRTSSFSSTKLRQPSFGTAAPVSPDPSHPAGRARLCSVECVLDIPKAVTFFPFLINCTLTHFRMAELGCLASTPTFSRTMPLAWEDPPKGEDLNAVPSARFLYDRSAHLCSRRWFCNFLSSTIR
jgi:hypothetical protein